MSTSDSDLELAMAIYSAARASVVEKERANFADHFLEVLEKFGFDIADYAEQIGEHDKHLANGIDAYIEHEEDEDTDEEEEWD